jgi:hypothetical protein
LRERKQGQKFEPLAAEYYKLKKPLGGGFYKVLRNIKATDFSNGTIAAILQ